jgi:hypothetical protein
MFSATSFWIIFWTELITTFWTSLGGPIDYHLPYPTRFSYVGEHALVWTVFVFGGHAALRIGNVSPFTSRFTSIAKVLLCASLLGLFGEISASVFLWHEQAISTHGVKIWVDPMTPEHALRSFMIERLTTWLVVIMGLSFLASRIADRKKILNQGNKV